MTVQRRGDLPMLWWWFSALSFSGGLGSEETGGNGGEQGSKKLFNFDVSPESRCLICENVGWQIWEDDSRFIVTSENSELSCRVLLSHG